MRQEEREQKKKRLVNRGQNETDLWELNRLQRSGAVKVIEADRDLDENEERVILQVHDIKPPFLSEEFTYSLKTETIQVVRDPTSDFAQISKKGSQILKTIREKNDRAAMKEKFWEL